MKLAGLCRFLEAACPKWIWVAGAIALHFILMTWLTALAPNQPLRVLLYLASNSVIIGLIGNLLWGEGRTSAEPGIYTFMAGMCGLHVLYNLVRIAVVSSVPIAWEGNILPPAVAISFLEGLLFSVLMAISCILMISQRVREQLEIMVRTDELSGLGNRRHFMESLHREAERSRRYQRPLSLVVLDIDRFKRINDTHGHHGGDAVIRQVGQILRRELREQDIICRMGGEEFAILMPETGEARAYAIADRLRELMMQAKLDGGNGDVSFTASFGVTELFPHEAGVEKMLQRVDNHLYRAKHHGRNRVFGTHEGQSPVMDWRLRAAQRA